MDGDIRPKELLSQIPTKPPRLSKNLLPKLDGNCNDVMLKPSESTSTPGTEASVHDDKNESASCGAEEIGVVDIHDGADAEKVSTLGNSPDSDEAPINGATDDGSVIPNLNNPRLQTSSLSIGPVVEGCVSATDEDPKNSLELVVSTKTKQQANFGAKPKILQPQGNSGFNGIKSFHRSVDTITRIATDPSTPASARQFQVPPPSVIHHVINLPIRRFNSIMRRRKKAENMSYNKAKRLSQTMLTEYKTSCADRPGSRTGGGPLSTRLINKQGSCRNNVESVGRSVKKRVESWYRKRVKKPVVQLSVDLGLDKIPLPFGSSATKSSQSLSPHASSKSGVDDTDDEDYTLVQGQNEFEDLRKLVKSGGDFCIDLAGVLQERSELEAQYAKGLSKLSGKLVKAASKETTGSVAHAWQAVAVQMDTQAELHKQWSAALLDEVAKPLRNSTETQHKIRKSVEGLVEKTKRNLAEWRAAETKSKRQCFSNSKEFEKIQESSTSLMSTANLHSTGNLSLVNGSNGTMTRNNSVLEMVRSRSQILNVTSSDKDPIKLEAKRRKAEDAVRRADIKYYTFCVKSERARLEWESAVRNGTTCLRTLEEEKLTLLKDLALKYFQHFKEFIPNLVQSAESLEEPIRLGSVDDHMYAVVDIRRHAGMEQLLPDFYAEDTSNLMQKERRQEALEKFLDLIKQDLEREKKQAVGIEKLAKAIAKAPKVDNAHHDISDKVYYMKSMLMYLEGARCKMENALADLEGIRPNDSITQYLRYQRDNQGLPQTILKIPTWVRDEYLNYGESTGSHTSPDLTERDCGAGDGTSSNRPDTDSDFDEFSSEESENDEEVEVFDGTGSKKLTNLDYVSSIGQCRVIFDYNAKMFDELTIRIGEIINVHDKQEDDWWLGELNGVVGMFPGTYVELVTADSDTSSAVPKVTVGLGCQGEGQQGRQRKRRYTR